MTNSKSKTACAGGFTLLEILISVGILSTALVVFVTAQGSAFLASERGELLNQAVFLAREKMTEAEIKIEEDLAKEIDCTRFSEAYPPFFPRFISLAIWRFCGVSPGLMDICNGKNIRNGRCRRNDLCPVYYLCDRVRLK